MSPLLFKVLIFLIVASSDVVLELNKNVEQLKRVSKLHSLYVKDGSSRCDVT